MLSIFIEIIVLAHLVCSESGWDTRDGKYVLLTLENRARINGTSLMEEALKPNQYSLSNCKSLKKDHLVLAQDIINGKIRVKEPGMAQATHFATTTALAREHSRCPGYTIRDVWEHHGFVEVHRSNSGHVYFRKRRRFKSSGRCPG
jgi:hypothetical protein